MALTWKKKKKIQHEHKLQNEKNSSKADQRPIKFWKL